MPAIKPSVLLGEPQIYLIGALNAKINLSPLFSDEEHRKAVYGKTVCTV